MLARCSRSYEKVEDLSDLKTRFESLSLSNDITQLLALDNFIHRLIGERETIRGINCWLMTFISFQASSKFTQFLEPTGTFSKIQRMNSEFSRVWINWRRVVPRRKCSDLMMSFSTFHPSQKLWRYWQTSQITVSPFSMINVKAALMK